MPSNPSPVTISGRYRLEERIGSGGYSEVWRASDEVLRRPVAVKLLHEAYAQHPETLHRFRAEARHAGSISNQNIARVYDYGDPDQAHPAYLVMELVAGPSLAEVLRSGSPLDAARCMDIVAQTAAGLEAAHQAGLVHRDIKPANLLLSPPGIIKITDFGISHAVGSAPVTSTGVIIGTPGYLAPERAAGAQATYLSDLYSLGVVAYECLAGEPPFGGSALEVALAHQGQPFPELPPGVPAEAAALIRQLTAKDPADRPATAKAVAGLAAGVRDRLRAGIAPTLDIALPDPALPAAGVMAGRSDTAGLAGAAWPDAEVPAALGVTRAMTTPRGRRPGGRMLAGAAAVAGLVALTAAGIMAASAPDSGAGTTHQAAPAAATKIDINSQALIGEPVSAVVRQLRHEGLSVRVRWRQADEDQAGLVLRVRPAGKVQVQSLVTVVGALSEFRHGGDHGDGRHGDGHGGHGGGGDGQGNGDGGGRGHGHGHGDESARD